MYKLLKLIQIAWFPFHTWLVLAVLSQSLIVAGILTIPLCFCVDARWREYWWCVTEIERATTRINSEYVLDVYIKHVFKRVCGNYGRYAVCELALRDTVRHHPMYFICRQLHVRYIKTTLVGMTKGVFVSSV